MRHARIESPPTREALIAALSRRLEGHPVLGADTRSSGHTQPQPVWRPRVSRTAIAMKIAKQAQLVLKQFVNALSPLIAELQSQGDVKRLRQILISGTKFAVAPAVLALVGLGIFGRQAITLWLDPSLASAWPVLMVLMTAMVVSVPELVAANVLTMSGHYRLPARASVVSAAVNVVVSLILAMRFGMMGIAVGTLIAAVLVNGVVVAAALRVHDLSWNDYIRGALRPHLIPAAGATALGLVIRDVIDPSSLGIIVVGFVALATLFAWLFWRGRPRPARKAVGHG